MPLVSIIMAAHKAGPWIDAALESVRAQTHKELEIIVVDDASPDDTAARVRIHAEYDSRITLLSLSENIGQSAALNRGLARARGEFVKFCDADDLLSPDMVSRQIRALLNRPRSLAYSEWARFTDNPSEAVFTPRPEWRDASSVDWLVTSWSAAEGMMQCGQFLIPRPLLDANGGWDEQLGLINDLEFFTRLIVSADDVIFTPGARLYYRSGLSGSLSVSRGAGAWRSAHRSAMRAVDHLLAAEDSPRTRLAATTTLASILYSMYPNQPVLCSELEHRISGLGGTQLRASGGRGFLAVSRIAGWKTARWIQVLAGKYPRPLAR